MHTLSAAIGFPIVILWLVPVRTFLVPRLPFTEDELAILDGPTASPFVRRVTTLGCMNSDPVSIRLWSP